MEPTYGTTKLTMADLLSRDKRGHRLKQHALKLDDTCLDYLDDRCKEDSFDRYHMPKAHEFLHLLAGMYLFYDLKSKAEAVELAYRTGSIMVARHKGKKDKDHPRQAEKKDLEALAEEVGELWEEEKDKAKGKREEKEKAKREREEAEEKAGEEEEEGDSAIEESATEESDIEGSDIGEPDMEEPDIEESAIDKKSEMIDELQFPPPRSATPKPKTKMEAKSTPRAPKSGLSSCPPDIRLTSPLTTISSQVPHHPHTTTTTTTARPIHTLTHDLQVKYNKQKLIQLNAEWNKLNIELTKVNKKSNNLKQKCEAMMASIAEKQAREVELKKEVRKMQKEVDMLL
ncbi:uncharacterized protein MYCGRDRAFT_97683 [Zymoseptoria tritici IPO323]|uniref:Uncharacterized protein n=1 Tax=Zymoseptoria tritici (strain CBS 115943 / IPO323) TaxID=336722 RepID=F9XQZ7_ZYMTI|nr:uncharacterized protein MYCGRDRAFT_97683 [Zymoseptoria tritici IPO323]EGP82316.1 hypothetical protein MYCGRDRAFT_97683 [Zymoseptoria tritici IPO323]